VYTGGIGFTSLVSLKIELIMKISLFNTTTYELEKLMVCGCYAGTRTSSELGPKLKTSEEYLLEYINNLVS
jgi:hypothetical protein